MIVIVIV